MAKNTLKVMSWIVPIVLLITITTGFAENYYVTDDFEITLRSGPGTDRKILSLIDSGKALTLKEKGDDWSLVQTSTGKEGWVLNRYLTTKEPCAMVLERVRQDYDVMSAKFQDLKSNFDELNKEKKSTDTNLSQSRQERDELDVAYQKLKKESADYLNLKKRHQQMVSDLEAEKTRSAKLEEENMQMKRSRIIQWVLTGGGIMLVGFFIGLFSSSRRKPRSSLY